ncbi:MAG TPA: ComEC/Rec2 family competence protein, partial [Myxococcota bacterium]|nr:ComEC/Rec2 family competence protein [Myxococcota bacterium]
EDLIAVLAPGEGDTVTAVGTVVEVEAERGYTLDAVTLSAPAGERELDHPLRVVAPPFDPPALGSSVRVEVELARARVPINPSTTPRHSPRPFAVATGEAYPHGEASWAALASLHLRERLTFVSPVATSLYRALLLGDRSDLSPEARFAYQDTGTAHLLAISGMNLALLGFGLFAVLRFSLLRFPPTRRLGQGRRLTALAALIALLSIGAYGRIIAPSDATDRAIIAFALVALGLVLMRRPSGPRTVALCALAALVIDPLSALRPGFQLSFAATSALVLVATPLARWRAAQLGRTGERPGWLVRVRVGLVIFLVANLVTSVATLPLGLAWFGQLPLHGLWVNLVAIPFMSLLVFPAGVIFAVLVTVVPPLFDPLAPLLVLFAEAFDAFIVGAGELVGPSSTQAWPLSLALCSTVGLLMMVRPRVRLAGAGLTALASLAVFIARGHDDGRLVLHVLDVGHGDAMALTLPNGQRVVIDVGGHLRPEANRVMAERVVLPSLLALGFERVDLLVLTHGDLDHAGAALALAQRLRVGELWVPP